MHTNRAIDIAQETRRHVLILSYDAVGMPTTIMRDMAKGGVYIIDDTNV